MRLFRFFVPLFNTLFLRYNSFITEFSALHSTKAALTSQTAAH